MKTDMPHPTPLEACIKVALIDHLMPTLEPGDTLACETAFADGRRRADVLTISTDLHAYEIKGDRDNLDKLANQISDYQRCFDFVSIVTTRKHVSKASNIVPKSIGILLYEDNRISQVRIPKRRVRLSKSCLAEMLDRNSLQNIARNIGISTNIVRIGGVAALRGKIATKLSLNELRSAAVANLRRRYADRFDQFRLERGRVTHVEDLLLLTNRPDNIG